MIDWQEIVRLIASWSVYLIYLAVIVSTIWVVVLENRSPVKTIAWVLVLVFLPVIGLIFYFFFNDELMKLENKADEKTRSRIPFSG